MYDEPEGVGIEPLDPDTARETLLALLNRFSREANGHRRLVARVRDNGWLIPLRDAGLITREDRGWGDWVYKLTLLGGAWQAGTETRTLRELKEEAIALCAKANKRRCLIYIYGRDFLYRDHRDYKQGPYLETPSDYDRRYTDDRIVLEELRDKWGDV